MIKLGNFKSGELYIYSKVTKLGKSKPNNITDKDRTYLQYYFFPDDHIILSASSFRGFIPRNLVVRTVTTDDEESADSELVKLPHSLISEITDSAAKELKEVSKRVSSVFVSNVIRLTWKFYMSKQIHVGKNRISEVRFHIGLGIMVFNATLTQNTVSHVKIAQFCHFAIYIQLARFKIPQFYHTKIFKTIVKDN
jgi:hypothetical protein